MPRIAGVDLPRDKRAEIALTYVYGIGRTCSNQILVKAGVSPDTRMRDMTEDEAARINDIIQRDYVVEGDKRREVQANIQEDIQASRRFPALRIGVPAGINAVPTIFVNGRFVPRWLRGDTPVLDRILMEAARK